MEMTSEELEEFESAYNHYYAESLASEDDIERRYYQGKFMGVDFTLDVLGYTVMADGAKVKFLSDSGKSMECDHYKVIKNPRKNRERRKRGG